jgi:hypothetical protein
MRNRIINGDMRIDQRNAGASVTVTSGGVFITDRWESTEDTDGTMTAQQSTTAPAGFTSSLLFTTGTADASLGTSQYVFFQQKIEGFNVADLGWGTASAQSITLSFWVRSSLTGTFGGALRNSTANRSYPFTYTISAANTWEQKSVTIAGDTTGTWVTNNDAGILFGFGLGVGSSLSGTAGAWNSNNNISATGAISVIGTAGATFFLTGVQLEPGTVATPFERRSYGQELILCQRYFETSYPAGTAVGAATTAVGIGGISLNTGDLYTSYSPTPFVVPKRASPTINFYAGTTGTAGVLYNNSASSVQGNAGSRFVSQYGCTLYCSNNAMTAANAFSVNFTASAEL